MERGQFTFYRSYWEAIQSLPKKDRLAAYEAIAEYALDGTQPQISGGAATVFILVKPTLDTGRKRAEIGKAGGSKSKENSKQTESKTEAKAKQSVREKEREKEIEDEKEIEIENDSSISPIAPKGFDLFWSVYPNKVGKDAARRAYAKVKVPTDVLVSAVEAQKRSQKWTADNGRYIPNPATWLNQGRWQDEITAPAKTIQTPEDRRTGATLDDLRRMQAYLEDRG